MCVCAWGKVYKRTRSTKDIGQTSGKVTVETNIRDLSSNFFEEGVFPFIVSRYILNYCPGKTSGCSREGIDTDFSRKKAAYLANTPLLPVRPTSSWEEMRLSPPGSKLQLQLQLPLLTFWGLWEHDRAHAKKKCGKNGQCTVSRLGCCAAHGTYLWGVEWDHRIINMKVIHCQQTPFMRKWGSSLCCCHRTEFLNRKKKKVGKLRIDYQSYEKKSYSVKCGEGWTFADTHETSRWWLWSQMRPFFERALYKCAAKFTILRHFFFRSS